MAKVWKYSGLLLIGVVVIAIALVSFFIFKQTNIPATNSSITVPSSTDEEYNVYSVLINSHYMDDRIKLIVINENTWTGELNAAYIEQNIPELQQETIDDFTKANEQSHLLQKRFDLPVNYILISQEELNDIFDSGSGWDGFYRKYPDSQGTMTLSRVGFNAEKNQALVYVGNQSHYLAGAGHIVLLVKENGIWKIKRAVMTWIS